MRIHRISLMEIQDASLEWGMGLLGSSLLEGYIGWLLEKAGFDLSRPYTWRDDVFTGERVYCQGEE